MPGSFPFSHLLENRNVLQGCTLVTVSVWLKVGLKEDFEKLRLENFGLAPPLVKTKFRCRSFVT